MYYISFPGSSVSIVCLPYCHLITIALFINHLSFLVRFTCANLSNLSLVFFTLCSLLMCTIYEVNQNVRRPQYTTAGFFFPHSTFIALHNYIAVFAHDI